MNNLIDYTYFVGDIRLALQRDTQAMDDLILSKQEDSKIGGVVNYIVELLAEQDIEYRNVYTELFFMKKVPAPAKIIINKYSNSHQNCLLPHMNFMAMLFEIIKALQNYRKAMTGK
jgi:hypothetical protein